MAIVLSSQGITSGAFATFPVGMGKGVTNYYSAAVLMKLDESGPFDMTTLMPASGGTVGISGSVSIGALPSLPAGSAAIGSIIGRTSSPSVTPVITAGAYTAGQEIGGLMTFAVGGAGSGILESIRVACKSIQTTQLKLYVFDTNPSNSTWTDHSTPAINALDVFSLLDVFPLSSPDSGLGTHTIWNSDGLGCSFVGANLYCILVCVGTPTFASTSGIIVRLGIVDD